MDFSSCILQAAQQGADVPFIRRTPSAQDALSSLVLAPTSLSENHKVAFGEGPRAQEDAPRGRALGDLHSVRREPPGHVCVTHLFTLQAGKRSRGPLQVRNPAPETGKPSHAGPPWLREAFESRGPRSRVGVTAAASVVAARGSAPLHSFRPAAERLRQDASSCRPPLRSAAGMLQ